MISCTCQSEAKFKCKKNSQNSRQDIKIEWEYSQRIKNDER